MIHKKDLTPYQLEVLNAKICPYCKSNTRITTEQEVYGGRIFSGHAVIACANYPTCDAYVGTHKDGSTLGRLANQRLRLIKKECKEPFNRLWQLKFLPRDVCYEQLSEYLQLDRSLTHFGMFGIESCEKASKFAIAKLIELSNKEKSIVNTKS